MRDSDAALFAGFRYLEVMRWRPPLFTNGVMTYFSRYILFETGKVFSVALLALTFLMVMVGVVKEAVQQGLGLLSILQLAPYLLPSAMVFAVPGTLLFAVSLVYGRLSADNEIVAIKSLGISPWRLIWPVYVLSFVLSLITVGLYELGAVWGHQGAQRVVFTAVEEIAYGALRSQRSITTDQFSMTVTGVKDRILLQPNIDFYPAKGNSNKRLSLSAQEGWLKFDPHENVLTFTCRNGSLTSGAEESLHFADEFTHHIALGSTDALLKASSSPGHLPLGAIPAEIQLQKKQIDQQQQRVAMRAALELATGEFDELSGPAWDSHADSQSQMHTRLNKLRTEPPRRWAAGFSCICFACIGAPMAIRRRSSDFVTSFFMCFLPILIVYYPFMMFGLDRAKAGDVPPYMVWTGNVVLLIWGGWLLRRVLKY